MQFKQIQFKLILPMMMQFMINKAANIKISNIKIMNK